MSQIADVGIPKEIRAAQERSKKAKFSEREKIKRSLDELGEIHKEVNARAQEKEASKKPGFISNEVQFAVEQARETALWYAEQAQHFTNKPHVRKGIDVAVNAGTAAVEVGVSSVKAGIEAVKAAPAAAREGGFALKELGPGWLLKTFGEKIGGFGSGILAKLDSWFGYKPDKKK